MKKFKIVIDDLSNNTPIRSTRKHYNIEMELSNCPAASKMKSILNRLIVSQARSFKFTCDGMVNSKSFSATLARMTLLEDLHIGYVYGFTKFSFSFNEVNLPRLKEISLMGHETEILSRIAASNVTKMTLLSLYSNALSPSAGDHLTSFLKNCNKTVNLWIDSNYAERFFRSNWKDCDIKLSSLCVRSSVRPLGIAISLTANLKSFLITQAPTLTDLDFSLESQDGLPEDFFRQIFTVLRHLSGLEMLTLPYEIDDISKIAQFNQKLTSLSVKSITKPLEAGLNMKNLTVLNVESIPDAESWKSIIMNSPQLGWVTVSNEIGQDFRASMKVLMQHPNVQDLVISSHETSRLKKIFDQISSNYGNLESLSLKLEQFENRRSMEISFPADPTEWNKIEQKKRFRETFLLGR